MSNNIDWPGLLKWSLSHTDGTSSSSSARSREDLEFLEKAIKEFFANEVDPNQLVKDAVNRLSSDPSQAPAALAVIQECLDMNAEIGRNLDKLGAMEPLVKCLKSNDTLTLETCLAVLSFALPNNPPIQLKFFELGGLDLLLNEMKTRKEMVNSNSENETRLFSRILTCVSAAVKNESTVAQAFLNAGGASMLINLLQSCNNAKILAKVIGILRYFIDSSSIAGLSSMFPKDQVAQGLVNAMSVLGTSTEDWGSSDRVVDSALHLVDNWMLLHKKEEDKWSPSSAAGQALKKAAEMRVSGLTKLVKQEPCAADEVALLKQLMSKL